MPPKRRLSESQPAAPMAAPAAGGRSRPQRSAAAAASASITVGAAAPSAAERAALTARLPRKQPPVKKAVAARVVIAPDPGDTSDESSKSGASDGEESVGEDDAPAETVAAGREDPPAKRRRAADPSLACMACHADFPADTLVDGYYCPVCELIYTADEKSIVNQRRHAKLMAAAAAPIPGGASSVHSSQLDTASNNGKPKLGAYEAELRRLLELSGDPVPRFQVPDPLPHGDAIAGLRDNSYIGTTFAHQSPWLTKLIRSGHFKELSLALPVTNADALRRRTAEAKGSKVLLSAAGELTSTAESHTERPLSGLQEFLKILVVSILPSLFDRPRASLDWLELGRSVIDIAEREGWPVASRYLSDLLSDRVPTAAPFNKFDPTILQAARVMATTGAPGSGGSHVAAGAAAAAGGRAGERPAYINACQRGVCRDWNLFTCPSGAACKFRHVCCWVDCPTADDGHKGRDCPRKPANAPVRSAPAPGAARGRRGGGAAKAAPVSGARK